MDFRLFSSDVWDWLSHSWNVSPAAVPLKPLNYVCFTFTMFILSLSCFLLKWVKLMVLTSLLNDHEESKSIPTASVSLDQTLEDSNLTAGFINIWGDSRFSAQRREQTKSEQTCGTFYCHFFICHSLNFHLLQQVLGSSSSVPDNTLTLLHKSFTVFYI